MIKAPGSATVLAFAGAVLLGGLNGTAIRIGSNELPPLWGAALRFGLASLVFFAIVGARRIPLPRGRALVGSVLYGLLGFGVAFALVYASVVEAGPGTAQVILALVPLLTLLLAITQGVERFRAQSLAGSLLAVAGIALVFYEKLGGHGISLALLGILGAAFAIAESNVVVKRLPRANPLSNNAVAMGTGTLLLLVLSLIAGEKWVVPQQAPTILGLAYLVLLGSVVVFTLYLVVIERWTASATSYQFLLMPLVAVVAAAVLIGEPITPLLIVGAALVLVGVYFGAFAPSFSRPLPGLFHRAPTLAAAGAAGDASDGPPSLISPNCP